MISTREPPGPWAPVVASLPHGGELVPDDVRAQLLVPPRELWNTDWHTPLLYDFLPELGVPVVETTLNRYVVDANRDPAQRYGDFRRAAVAAATPWGAELYAEPPDDAELDRRLALGHTPYHVALDSLVERALSVHERVLLLDLHSFGVPLEADVVVGDGRGTTASAAALELVVGAFERAGHRVRTNHRFTGGWIVRRFASRDDVDALLIELHYSCYLRPEGWPRARPRLDEHHLGRARGRLHGVLREIVAAYAQRG